MSGKLRRRYLGGLMTLTGGLAGACGVVGAPPGPGQPSTGQATTGPAAAAKTPVTLKVLLVQATTHPRQLKNIASAFNAKTPHITIDWQHPGEGDLNAKMLALAASNQLFDIMRFGVVSTASLAAIGALRGLNQYIARDKYDLSDFWPWAMEGNKWKGDRYNMAVGTNTNVLLYNQDLFNRAGMVPPNKDWGWNELLEAAKKLTRRPSDPAQAQFGFVVLDTTRYAIGPWIWMNGSLDVSDDMTKSLIDSPKSREALQWLADLIHKHRVWPAPQELPELGVSNMRQLLDSGRVAMAYAGYWLREEYMSTPPAFPYEITEPPKGPATRAGFYHQGPFHIGKDTRIPDDAWTFLSWLASVDGTKEFVRNIPGGLPGRRSVARQKEFLDLLGPVPLAVVEYSREWPLHPELANLQREFNQGLTPVWRGESSVAAATENIARAQNALLQKPT